MRDQLHLMELVDNYLDGAMSNQDRSAFEERMRNNEELRALVEDQQRLRRAARRSPARAAVKKAYGNYRWGKWAPGLGASVIVIIAATASLFLWNSQKEKTGSDGAPITNEEHRLLTDTTGTRLEPLVFTIDPTKDTTLVTLSGIVLDVPRGAFTDSAGKPLTSPVRVTLLEALDPLDIMRAGLSTMSGDTLLETGGMFNFDAQANGSAVKIDPAKPITAMVPSFDGQEDMQLYQGVKRADGVIDWRNPRPLTKSLIPVDITTLNFYPPGYETKLAELGQDVTNKAFKDSLYYSYSGDGIVRAYSGQSEADVLWSRVEGGLDSVIGDSAVEANTAPAGMDPAKVKVVWGSQFNNTNIATREFEERMRAIHRTCGNEVLEMYVTGLDKDLAEVDAAVGGMGYPEFDHFTERNEGRVQLPAHAADRLRTFYENQSRAEAAAIRKTQEKFWREQRKADLRSDAKRAEHSMAESVREGQLFEREFEANLDTVYKQLGYQRIRLPRSAWVVPVVATGWWNVDKAVLAATTNRASLSYTDHKTGKTATLTYTPLAVEVTDRASFDELFVYLLPRQLNSYQRMKEDGGIFSERLNSIFAYDLFCLGMKGKQQFAFITSINGQGEVTASLQPVDENALRQMLKTKGRVEDQLLDEARYLDWLVVDKQRRQANIAREELRNALLPVVFPCADSDASKEAPRSTKVTVDSGPVVYWSGATLDERAEFPGGLNALQRFLTTSVVYPPDARAQGVGGRVLVGFRIDRSGKVVDIKIERSVNEQLDAEAMRVVGLMPKWKPAAVNGQPVDIAMSLPILFEAL